MFNKTVTYKGRVSNRTGADCRFEFRMFLKCSLKVKGKLRSCSFSFKSTESLKHYPLLKRL